MTTIREQNKVMSDADAAFVLGSNDLPAGYMRAVIAHGTIGWLRHLKVARVFIFTPVESFPAGVGLGALRKMCY